MVDRAEFIECTALEDLHRAAPAEVVARLGLRAIWRDSAFVSVAGGLPAGAIVINRSIGLGMAEPATPETVEAIVQDYAGSGVTRFFVHLHPHSKPASLASWLRAAGLERARGWQKFERGTETPAPRPTDFAVRQVGREHGEDFACIVCSAFDLGDPAVPWLAEIPGRAGWHVFMSFSGDTPAGTGAMFVHDGLAWFDFGATAPQFRGRGSQGTLLDRRIGHAQALQCRRLFTCTGEAVDGDPQHSYRNILKAGFRKTLVRENFAPGKA